MIVRDASSDDLSAIADVAQVADPPDEGDDVDLRYYGHLLEHGHLVVAEASGIVIGYAAAIDVGVARHITDLFLHPDVRGGGAGRALLEALTSAEPSAPWMTFSSLHPAALPLYARRGMVPRWPLLYLRGSADLLPPSPFRVHPIDPVAAARLELEWLGWDRTAQYRFWAGAAGSYVMAVQDGNDVVAVGCMGRRRQRRTLLHLAIVDEGAAEPAVLAALAAGGEDVLAAVPGEGSSLVPLLDAGWRVMDHDVFCSSEVDLVDPRRLIPHPGLM